MKRRVVFSTKENKFWNSNSGFSLLEDGTVANRFYNTEKFKSAFPTIGTLENVKSIYYSCGILMAVTENGLLYADPNMKFFKKFHMFSVEDLSPEIVNCIDDLRSWKKIDKLFYFSKEEWVGKYTNESEFEPLHITLKGRPMNESQEENYMLFGVIGLCKDGSVVKTGQLFEEDDEYLNLKNVKDVFTCEYGYALITKDGKVYATKELAWMNQFENVNYIVEHTLFSFETNKAYTIFFNDGTASFVWISTTNGLFKKLYNMENDKVTIQVDHASNCVMINDFQWLQVTPEGLKSWTGYVKDGCYMYSHFKGEHILVGPDRWSDPPQERKLSVYKKPIKIAAPYDRYAKYKNSENLRNFPWLAMYENGVVKVGGLSNENYNGIDLSPGVVLSTTAVDIAFEDGELVIYEQ